MGFHCSGIPLVILLDAGNHRNGIQIGKDENYYSPGHPSLIKNYNDSGQEEGLWQEWWPNGNKKLVAQCHKGLIISDEEYFPNGNFASRKNRRPAKKIRVKGTQAPNFFRIIFPDRKSNWKGDKWNR